MHPINHLIRLSRRDAIPVYVKVTTVDAQGHDRTQTRSLESLTKVERDNIVGIEVHVAIPEGK